MIIRGFTIIELLVVIGIFITVAAISAPVYGNWQNSAQLTTLISEIKQVIRQAQAGSMAGLNNSIHGVYFDVSESTLDKVILYQGSSYVDRNQTYDLEIILPSNLALSTDIPGAEISFISPHGEPSATGTIMIVDQATDQSDILEVNDLGFIL